MLVLPCSVDRDPGATPVLRRHRSTIESLNAQLTREAITPVLR
jgi:hypothetical protein